MSARYRVTVPASSANMGPGFDQLAMALDFHLTVEGTPHNAWQFDLGGEGAHLLDDCEYNLVATSYMHLCRQQGWPENALKCNSVSQIPLGRGLGSSAAAIVAGMSLAQWVNTGALDKRALFHAAVDLEGHADNVAAAVFGGLQMVDIDGNQYAARQLPMHADINLLLVVPSQMKSTSEMRQVLPETIPENDLKMTTEALEQLIMGLADGDLAKLKYSEADRRHQPYRLAAMPQSGAIFNLLSTHPDVAGAYLSGAGTTVAGIIVGGADPSMEVQSTLMEMGADVRVMIARPDDNGITGDLIG